MRPSRIDILGCPVDAVDLPGAVRRVTELVDDAGGYAAAVNASKLVRMRDDALLRRHVRGADLVVADGASVVRAARRRGSPLPARVTGVDLCAALLAVAPAHGWRTLLFGGRPEVVEEAARRTGATAWHHGWLDDPAPALARIREVRPHLLFVGLGTPRQERFLEEHRRRLPVAFAMGVGGAFDVFAGRVPRAPTLVGDLGLEWAWRLAHEPRARWRRALGDSLRFVWRLARDERLPEDP